MGVAVYSVAAVVAVALLPAEVLAEQAHFTEEREEIITQPVVPVPIRL